MQALFLRRISKLSYRRTGGFITSVAGGASALSREQVRQLEHPTYLRRQHLIGGIAFGLTPRSR